VRRAPPPIPPHRGAAHWRTARAVVRQCLRWRALAHYGAHWRKIKDSVCRMSMPNVYAYAECLCRIKMSVPNAYAECRIKSVQLSGQQQCACVHFPAHSYFKGKK